jgi:hypothetical protein
MAQPKNCNQYYYTPTRSTIFTNQSSHHMGQSKGLASSVTFFELHFR